MYYLEHACIEYVRFKIEALDILFLVTDKSMRKTMHQHSTFAQIFQILWCCIPSHLRTSK